MLRRLGRELVKLGSEKEDPPHVDYRWNDPQTESEAVRFLAARLRATLEHDDSSCAVLIGGDDALGDGVEQELSGKHAVHHFKTLDDFLAFREKDSKVCAVAPRSTNARFVHTLAMSLVSNSSTADLPFEYVVVPRKTNEINDRMWENSNDFLSPLHVDEVDCHKLFQESLALFEPKTGIRDFLDLAQGLKHVLEREVPGDTAEFGSFKGQSGYLHARYLQETGSDKRLFMFDTFESFPKESIGVDYFWSETHHVRFEEVKEKFSNLPRVTLVKGDFTKTLLDTDCGPLSLAYVDCDSFRGTKFLIEEIFEKRLSNNGLMIFEDYGHANLLGNRLAVHQAFERRTDAICFFSHFSGSYFVWKK